MCAVRIGVVAHSETFVADGVSVRVGDEVVVESEEGQDVGVVLSVRPETGEGPGRRILRLLDETDRQSRSNLAAREEDALRFGRERVLARGLPMKIVGSEFTLAGTRLTLYFKSEDRVDFRSLVRDFAERFHTRIELRQIGVRDAARHTGGTGICGRELCCSTFLPSFAPVTLRMAKDQNLTLQHDTLAGYCGRLRCCLQYEHELYRELRRDLPKLGKRVLTEKGDGRVKDIDVLRGLVRVHLEAGGTIEVKATELETPPDVLEQQARQRDAEEQRARGGQESKSAKRRRKKKE